MNQAINVLCRLCRGSRAVVLMAALLAVILPTAACATTYVRFQTDLGDFDVELYDTSMPVSVANFLAYVNSGKYDSTIIHRSTTYNPSDIQILQGGGYWFSSGSNQLIPVATDPPIILESGLTLNVRGTIAMARGAATDSATSQYFFNLQDNPVLDGNYAVFGKVVGAAGLAVLDAIGAVPVYDASSQLGPAFAELPLLQPSLEASSLVMINHVAVVPEPTTMSLAVVAIATAVLGRRRRSA